MKSSLLPFVLVLVHLSSEQSVLAFVPHSSAKAQHEFAGPAPSRDALIAPTLSSWETALMPRTADTKLFAADSASSDEVVVNRGLVRQTVLNQVLLGWTIWSGGIGAQVLARDASFTPTALLAGIAGAVPLVIMSRFIETSESSAVADLNLSTNLLMLRYFGDKPQPLVAGLVSAPIAALTGLSEEVNFRGLLISQLLGKTGSLFVAVVLSTLLFAVLHANPLSLFQGKESLKDSLVLIVYQIATGSVFAALFLSTGNLAVPIIAHALFDFYVFFFTHLTVTTQIQYAKKEASPMPAAPRSVEAKWKAERGDDFITSCKETFYLSDTNRDGVLSREELRIALYSYGVRLSKEDSATVASAADTDQSGAIDFGEFLEFVGPSGSPSKAIKGSLLGAVDRG